MHVLGKPIERHFTSDAALLRSVVDYRSDRSKLRSHADVIDEPSNLTLRLATLDLTEDKFRQRRQ